MEPNPQQTPPLPVNLESLPHPGIRKYWIAGPPAEREFHLSRVASKGADRLSDVEFGGAQPTGDAGWYRDDVADVLCDMAAWSYADGGVLIHELEHRNIVSPSTVCVEVPVRNDAMLVVATAFLIRPPNSSVGVIVFRGTEPQNIISFLTDATTEPKRFLAMGHVHGGFYRNLRAVWTEIAEWIDQESQKGLKTLYLTGHSLGGAMAVLAAATICGDPRFVRWQSLLKGVYTFGQPPVGDAEFARSCQERFGKMHFRHVYDHDLVPRLPPRGTGAFSHSGQEYVGSPEGWSPRSLPVEQAHSLLSIPIGFLAWVFRQFPLLRGLRLPFSVDDHSPNRYMEAFRAIREP